MSCLDIRTSQYFCLNMILIKVADPSISQPMSHMRCFEVAWSNLRHNINKLTGLIQQLTEQEPLFKLHENETRSGWTVAELLLESCFNPYLGPLAQSFTQGEAVCPLWSPCSSAKKKTKKPKKKQQTNRIWRICNIFLIVSEIQDELLLRRLFEFNFSLLTPVLQHELVLWTSETNFTTIQETI